MAFSLVSAAAAVRLLREGPGAEVGVRYGLLAAGVWFAASSVASHPDYLAYYNELVGSEPERALADSDLDWGQDANRLAARLRELGAARVTFAPFAVADFVKEQGFPPAFEMNPSYPAPGWNAVSISAWKVERFGLLEHPEATFWPDRVKPDPAGRQVYPAVLLSGAPGEGRRSPAAARSLPHGVRRHAREADAMLHHAARE